MTGSGRIRGMSEETVRDLRVAQAEASRSVEPGGPGNGERYEKVSMTLRLIRCS